MEGESNIKNIQEQIQRLQKSVDHSNDMLESIQRRARMSIIFTSIKWLIILGITLGSFFYIQEYIMKGLQMYDQVKSVTNMTGDISEKTKDIQNSGIIELFKAYMPR